MKNLIMVCLLGVLFPLSAMASQVKVQGQVYSSTNCGYFWTNEGDFSVSYNNDTLPWGVKIFMTYAFRETFHNEAWTAEKTVEISSSAPYVWTGKINDVVAQRGAFNYDALNFYFTVVMPDGHWFLDKGFDGYGPGYFQVVLPAFSCSRGEPQNLSVDAVKE